MRIIAREKRERPQPYEKSPYTQKNKKNQRTTQNISIKQRLRTDLGLLVGVAKAIKLV